MNPPSSTYGETRQTLPMTVSIIAVLLLSIYAVLFTIGSEMNIIQGLIPALLNVAPLFLWGSLTYVLVTKVNFARFSAMRLPLHVGCAALFSCLWYLSVITLLGMRNDGGLADDFLVRHFNIVAFGWQLFQGLAAYAAIVNWAEARRLRQALQVSQHMTATNARHLLVRSGDDLVRIAPKEILFLSGAGDQVQISTEDNTYLTRRRLNQFEHLLPRNNFLRVHRGHIINLEALLRAEPAGGGRMILHLRGKNVVKTSRQGARVLRSHTA